MGQQPRTYQARREPADTAAYQTTRRTLAARMLEDWERQKAAAGTPGALGDAVGRALATLAAPVSEPDDDLADWYF